MKADNLDAETTEVQKTASGGQEEGESQTKIRHVEEDELNEMNHTFNSTHCGGNISQEQQQSRGSCAAEEAANRSAVYFYLLSLTQIRPKKTKQTSFTETSIYARDELAGSYLRLCKMEKSFSKKDKVRVSLSVK